MLVSYTLYDNQFERRTLNTPTAFRPKRASTLYINASLGREALMRDRTEQFVQLGLRRARYPQKVWGQGLSVSPSRCQSACLVAGGNTGGPFKRKGTGMPAMDAEHHTTETIGPPPPAKPT
jgi:hypothetical protein